MNLIGGVGYSASGKSNVMMTVLEKHARKSKTPVVIFDLESDYTIFESRMSRRRSMQANRQRDEGERWWKRVFG